MNEYLRSDPGRAFISALNQEQINRKWTNVGEPLSEIEWLQSLRQTDPAQATEIVAQAMKLYNQNEVRGGRLIRQLQSNEMTTTQTRDWIGTEGIDGLNPIARNAIVTGRDNTLAGAWLMNDLEQGEGRLSQAWRREVHDRNNPSLMENFSSNPDVQLLDAMMRNHVAGIAIHLYVDNDAPRRRVVISGRNEDAEREMSRVELSRDGVLTVNSPDGDTFQITREGWNRNGIPMQGRQPGRAADEPDHTERMRGMHPLTPDHAQHHDHATLEQIRAGVRMMDVTAGKTYDEASERLSRSLLAASKDNRERYPGRDYSLAANALSRVDHVVLGNDGRYAFVVEGGLHDPTHKRAAVEVVQAMRTPIEQSDTKLETANQQIAQEQQLAQQQVLQRQLTISPNDPTTTSHAMRI